jgi:hypothetical protein
MIARDVSRLLQVARFRALANKADNLGDGPLIGGSHAIALHAGLVVRRVDGDKQEPVRQPARACADQEIARPRNATRRRDADAAIAAGKHGHDSDRLCPGGLEQHVPRRAVDRDRGDADAVFGRRPTGDQAKQPRGDQAASKRVHYPSRGVIRSFHRRSASSPPGSEW